MPVVKKHFSLSPLNDNPVVMDGANITGGMSHKDGFPTIKFSVPQQESLLETDTLHLVGQILIKKNDNTLFKDTHVANDNLNNGANLTQSSALNIPNFGGVKNVIDKVVIQSKKSLVEISSSINYSQFESLVEAYHHNESDYIHSPLSRGLASGKNATLVNRRVLNAVDGAVMTDAGGDADQYTGQFFSIKINTDLLNTLPLHLGADHMGGILITIHLAPDSAFFNTRHRSRDVGAQANCDFAKQVNYVLKNLKLEGRYVVPTPQENASYPNAVMLNSRLNLINDVQSSINSSAYTPQLQFVKSMVNLYLDNDQTNNTDKNANNFRHPVGHKANQQAKNGLRFPFDYKTEMKPSFESEIVQAGAFAGALTPNILFDKASCMGDVEVRKQFERALLGGVEPYHSSATQELLSASINEDYDTTGAGANGVGDNTKPNIQGIGADFTFNMGGIQNFVNQDYNLTIESGVNTGNAQLPPSRNGGTSLNPLLQQTFVRHGSQLSFQNLVKVI
tara:strand:+ start:6943 stop:8463 length:1521 start_codon:yes stop_codon:yes gene_type:complete